MTRNEIRNEYFNWLCELVCGDRYAVTISYRKLLMRLHDTEFTYLIERDSNRANDGMQLRYRFAISQGYKNSSDTIVDLLDGPCSVLEMMVALAIRCEETIMDDPQVGNRTGEWFWGMITNLGLGSMTDSRYDRQRVDDVVFRFLHRGYDRDGRGGLFRVRTCRQDMRDVEIFYQLCYYLDEIM